MHCLRNRDGLGRIYCQMCEIMTVVVNKHDPNLTVQRICGKRQTNVDIVNLVVLGSCCRVLMMIMMTVRSQHLLWMLITRSIVTRAMTTVLALHLHTWRAVSVEVTEVDMTQACHSTRHAMATDVALVIRRHPQVSNIYWRQHTRPPSHRQQKLMKHNSLLRRSCLLLTRI